MCGIAGIWGDADQRPVEIMIDRLAHRGPDSDGLYRSPEGRGVLGHCRLAIMDPSGGNQPLIADTGSAVVANGEIYNFRDLRRMLGKHRVYRTASDSEIILHLYDELAQDSAAQLDGMYAFLLADGRHVFAARDPIGIKPLYAGKHNGAWCFASELKALAGIADNVREFPAGTAFHSAHGYRRFYTVPETAPVEMPAQAASRAVRSTLEEAVRKRLMSDAPLGAFLSGGLDSSIIAAVARQHIPELHTFAVGTEASPDLQAARVVARHLDTIHHEYVLTADEAIAHLPEIIYHLESYDQDLVRSAIPCYFTARMAADHVKVILTGEGADELFAGYRYYREIDDAMLLHQELRRSVRSLHNINLQRVDRMTMAHGIEGRVPFLDVAMIELALKISPNLKLRRSDYSPTPEKWVLRKAFEDLLPPEIVWRDKEQFDEGSGTTEFIIQSVARQMTANECKRYTTVHRSSRLRSPEECVYHKLLVQGYSDYSSVLANVARWADRPSRSATIET